MTKRADSTRRVAGKSQPYNQNQQRVERGHVHYGVQENYPITLRKIYGSFEALRRCIFRKSEIRTECQRKRS